MSDPRTENLARIDAALAKHDEFMGVEVGAGYNPVENPAWTLLVRPAR